MAFTFVAFAYILALIVTAFLIFFAIFHIIAIDELKTDYKNPIEQCQSLNPLVLPEYGLHMGFNVLFILTLQWGSLAFNLPLMAYHIHRYRNRPVGMSGPGLYDPTTIMNADQLSRAMREGWVKLGFYLISFFYYLYSCIPGSMSSVVCFVKEVKARHPEVVSLVLGAIRGARNAMFYSVQLFFFLLARILSGLANLGVESGVVPQPPSWFFPVIFGMAGSISLWLFEHHPKCLTPNLRHSMKHLYTI